MAAEFVIGRDPGCDLVLGDKTVSKRHAVVVLEGDRAVFSDCSSNGTFLKTSSGGREKVARHVLAAGQVLCFGAPEVSAEVLAGHLQQHFGRPVNLSAAAAGGGQFRAVIRRPQPRPQQPPPTPEPVPEPPPQPAPQPSPQPSPGPSPAAPPLVSLCGASGAGKTTWLVRLLDHLGLEAAPEMTPILARVRAGLPLAADTAAPAECAVTVRGGGGGFSLRLRDGAVSADTAALICFASADPLCRAAHRSAVAAARSRFAGPAILVLSHCDRLLPPHHPAWEAGADWWRALPDGAWWADLADDFAGAVFPAGAIGHAADGVAACLDEFGGTVHLSAAPVGIDRPLRHLANHLRQAGA